MSDSTPAIADYGLLSNCQSAALVGRSGSIDWLCLPTFDAAPMFARILDDDAGHWSITPVRDARTSRAYIDDTMVMRTEFRCETGAAAVTDFLPLHPDDQGNDIGRRNLTAVMRIVEGLDGWVELDFELAARPEWGLTTPLVSERPGGFVLYGGPSVIVVSSAEPIMAGEGSLRAGIRVEVGDRHAFALQAAAVWDDPPDVLTPDAIIAALDETVAGWRSWAAKLTGYSGRDEAVVRRSALVLRALAFAPTGAIVAAPTSSLPEEPGGERNWDYRYCWVRDASFTVRALTESGCTHEAQELFHFFESAAAGTVASGHELQIVYGIDGRRHVPEAELPHLRGHRESRPVRVGNGAWDQTQLDIYGELLDAAWELSTRGGEFDEIERELLASVADRAVLRWTETDEGIWEVRGEPRHFTYSKLMCWVALDRAVKLADALDAHDRADRWIEERDRVRDAILTDAWSEHAGAYAQSFGSDDLDAATLQMLLTGFLPPDDERMRATVEAIAAGLTDEHGFVYRYRADDGVAGDEGTFGICTFWLSECLARIGEAARARELFDRMAGCANDLGLLAEELDPVTGEQLGNFPQAFTHIGLVNAALALRDAEQPSA